MAFNRAIWKHLLDWKQKKGRKPLILRGARQVGKTTLVKQLAASYKYSIVLNLEKQSDAAFFEKYDDVRLLSEALFLSRNISFKALSDTLLFIDEIQESPKAIQLLRYFYEELPDLAVIAAGSLLEFSMKNVKSFPVGRVEYLYLYPLNFIEYLEAIGHDAALNALTQIPIEAYTHSILYDLFNRYMIIGGMPEVVNVYLEKNNVADLPPVYNSIWQTYKADVEKYTSNETERKVIKHIMSSAHLYLDQRVKFQNFGNSNYRSREVSEAFRQLDEAKIIRIYYPTTETKPPIMVDLKKSPRMQFLDTGLVNFELGIQASMLGVSDLSASFKGALVPHVILQEYISTQYYTDNKPSFWVRDKAQSDAELDMLCVFKDKLIPIEIKSGATGSLKSLHQFIDASEHPYAVRIYGGEFKIEKTVTPKGSVYFLMNLPYFLGTKLDEYIAYFVENNKL